MTQALLNEHVLELSPLTPGYPAVLDYGGMRGWQWMFLIEGAMAVVVGIAAFFVIVDRPHAAKWLASAEQDALQAVLYAVVAASQSASEGLATGVLLGTLQSSLFFVTKLIEIFGVPACLRRHVQSAAQTGAQTGAQMNQLKVAGAVAVATVAPAPRAASAPAPSSAAAPSATKTAAAAPRVWPSAA